MEARSPERSETQDTRHDSTIELTLFTPPTKDSFHDKNLNDVPVEPQDESDLIPLVTHDAVQRNDPGSSDQPEDILRTSPTIAIGWISILMLFISTIIALASMALLTYLWAGQRDTSTAGQLWKLIVLRSWTPQVITLCTMALRWALAVQAYLFTSMLASVAVENFEVTLSQITAVSVMRATSAQPHELLWALLQGNLYLLWGVRTITLTVMLLLLQASFQFSSTILLSDIRAGSIRGPELTQNITYGHSGDLLLTDRSRYDEENPWGFKPPFWPAFAEYSEPPVQAENITDTGFVVRAFLPFTSAQDRQSIANYSGNATMIAARATCFRPALSNLNLTIAKPEESGGDPPGSIKGVLEMDKVPFEVLGGCKTRPCRGSPERPLDFECALSFGAGAISYPRSLREWALTLCRVDESQARSMFSNTSGPYLGPGYLLLNVTQSFPTWNGIGRYYNQSVTNFTVSGEQAWSFFDVPMSDARLSATLCYYNPGPTNYEVTMQSSARRTEPSFGWDGTREEYDSVQVRRQLGASPDPLSHSDRGLLTLVKDKEWPTDSAESMDLLGSSSGQSFGLCQFCVRPSSSLVHRALAALFQDVVINTANPALAMQALFTTVSQMTYYSLLSEFDLHGPAQTKHFVIRLMPRRLTGFTVVAVLVAAHFCCGVLILVTFLKRCQCSMLGQVWRCIAQVRSGDTDVVLKKAAVATDDEIKQWLEDHGKGEVRVGILPWRRKRV